MAGINGIPEPLGKLWQKIRAVIYNKYVLDVQHQDETAIPLLSNTMLEDKHQKDSSEVAALASDSEASIANVTSEPKKAPWWSYIWVSPHVNSSHLRQ
jgi:hypothetical protein